MVEYVTRTGLAAIIGATELTVNFDDSTPGAILAPTSKIGYIILAGVAKFNNENEFLNMGVKLLGEAIVGDVRILSHGQGIGASATGIGQDVQIPASIIPVDITVKSGKSVRIFALGAGTASVTFDAAITLVFV